ncbi:flavodoxin [Tatumella terrea]|uniref:flavodoxin n=1 Tax=Tatumella terrea TaxID=419007 RepID=UPI0031E3EB6D
MASIGIFIGTVYGNSQLIAEEAQPMLEAAGHQVRLYDEPVLSQWLDESLQIRLIITSTTGQGDFPDTIAGLYTAMKDQCGYQPTVRYGLIALGDSSYQEYCGAGQAFDQLLQEHQAQRIGEVLWVDAQESPVPEEVALPWIEHWITLL